MNIQRNLTRNSQKNTSMATKLLDGRLVLSLPTCATQTQKSRQTFRSQVHFFPSFSFKCSYLFRRERRSGPKRAKTAEKGPRVSAWLSSSVMSPRPLLFRNPGSPTERDSHRVLWAERERDTDV